MIKEPKYQYEIHLMMAGCRVLLLQAGHMKCCLHESIHKVTSSCMAPSLRQNVYED